MSKSIVLLLIVAVGLLNTANGKHKKPPSANSVSARRGPTCTHYFHQCMTGSSQQPEVICVKYVRTNTDCRIVESANELLQRCKDRVAGKGGSKDSVTGTKRTAVKCLNPPNLRRSGIFFL